MIKNKEIEPLKVSDVAQTLMFKIIWQRMPAKSFISGLWLRAYMNTPLFNNCFLRVLPMDKFKYFKYYMGNIILCTPGERGLWMQGTEEDRIEYALDIESSGKVTSNWDAVKNLEAELQTMYKKYFPYTKHGIINYPYPMMEQQNIIGRLNKEFWEGFGK